MELETDLTVSNLLLSCSELPDWLCLPFVFVGLMDMEMMNLIGEVLLVFFKNYFLF